MFVAVNMVKPAEVREVWNHNRFHAGLMIYTAVMVPVTDFLIGVLSALVIYGVLYQVPRHAGVAEPHLAEGTRRGCGAAVGRQRRRSHARKQRQAS